MRPLLEAFDVAIEHRLLPTTLEIAPGEMVALVGPNGSGKTSLLRSLAKVDDCDGVITIGGEELHSAAPARRARLVGFLPATRDLVWPLSVRDLVALGNDKDLRRTSQILEILELDSIADRRVDRLSTGERTRVLLGRILAGNPAAMLLDEPFSNLDPYWVKRLCEIIRSEIASPGRCAVISVHDLTLATRFDRLIALKGGSVVFDGLPTKFLESKDFEAIFRVRRSDIGALR